MVGMAVWPAVSTGNGQRCGGGTLGCSVMGSDAPRLKVWSARRVRAFRLVGGQSLRPMSKKTFTRVMPVKDPVCMAGTSLTISWH